MLRQIAVVSALSFAGLGATQASACDWGCDCPSYRYSASAYGYYAPPVSYGYYAAPVYGYYAAPTVYAPRPVYAYYAAPYYQAYSYRPRVYGGYDNFYRYASWRRW
jgi:hypothetical protein